MFLDMAVRTQPIALRAVSGSTRHPPHRNRQEEYEARAAFLSKRLRARLGADAAHAVRCRTMRSIQTRVRLQDMRRDFFRSLLLGLTFRLLAIRYKWEMPKFVFDNEER
jgi:hypothetical protein